MSSDPMIFAAINALVPVLVTALVFGAPVVLIFLLRHFRLKEKELELGHDRRLTSAEQERDTLRMQLERAESELEFLRRLVPPLEPRARVAEAPEIRVAEKASAASEPLEEPAPGDGAGASALRR